MDDRITFHHVISRHITSHHFTSHYITSHHKTSHLTMLDPIIDVDASLQYTYRHKIPNRHQPSNTSQKQTVSYLNLFFFFLTLFNYGSTSVVQVDRIGPMHQAGSDSLLTAQTFFSLVRKHLSGACDDQK